MIETSMASVGIQDVVAILLSLVAAAYVLRILVGTMYGRGCHTCSHSEAGGKEKATPDPARKLKRLPLVTTEQVGRPYSDEPSAESVDPESPHV